MEPFCASMDFSIFLFIGQFLKIPEVFERAPEPDDWPQHRGLEPFKALPKKDIVNLL